MSRFRSLDSRISFFAFADIITSVCGVLIFIALLLATDLGKPTRSHPTEADSALEQKLQDALAQQAQVDARNRRLQELLAAAQTAPDLETLKSDVARLRAQLSAAQEKQAGLASQMTNIQAALDARDNMLGLTSLKATIQRILQEAESLAQQGAAANSELSKIEQQVARLESQLLKLQKWDGQVWLIPEKSVTKKEPVVVIVDGNGATIERIDRPSETRKLNGNTPISDFKSYLGTLKSVDQYVVFELKPSGIELFRSLLGAARGMGFDVGYDALEEDKSPHVSSAPPSFDEDKKPEDIPTTPSIPNVSASNGKPGANEQPAPVVPRTEATNPPPVSAPAAAATPKPKSWWQKLLEWIGIE